MLGDLGLHKLWKHSVAARLAKSYVRRQSAEQGSFEAYVANAEHLHDLASEAGVPVFDPFTGLQRSDVDGRQLAVVGPDVSYYQDLVGEFGTTASRGHTALSSLRRAASAVLSWAGETLTIETLNDSGETSARTTQA